MLTCHVAGPGFIPIRCRIGLWRFISCPSTLETVYLLWLRWPRKWRCHLTDLEWDMKEPLRMTSCLAVTTLNVPTSEMYTPYIHAGCHGVVTGLWLKMRGLGYRSWLPQFGAVSLSKTLHLGVHSLNPGVNGYLVGQWLLVCVSSHQCRDGSRAVCSPGSWLGIGMNRSYNQGKLVCWA